MQLFYKCSAQGLVAVQFSKPRVGFNVFMILFCSATTVKRKLCTTAVGIPATALLNVSRNTGTENTNACVGESVLRQKLYLSVADSFD